MPHAIDPLRRRAGLSFGQLLAPNLMLLFMPVPHTSLFPWLTGLSRNQLIRYHRCVMDGAWELGLGLQIQRDQAASLIPADVAPRLSHSASTAAPQYLPAQLCPVRWPSSCSWMGHGTMWILTAHAVLYYVYWATSKTAGG